MSSSNIPSQFLYAMRQTGFEPECIIVADGKLHRFRDWLDKPGTKNGWYVLFPDYPPSGAFGCWKRGISERWCGTDHFDSHLMTQRLVSIDKALETDYEKWRKRSTEMWLNARPANGNHGYLKSKKVGAHGIRYLRGALLVPVMDCSGQLHGLQCIYLDGSKRFTKATNKRGHYHMIGNPHENIICIAEGYATAATIYEIVEHAVAVAFDAGNILPVAINLRREFPDYQLVICADNDWRIDGNPGLTKAQHAAERVGGAVIFPRFHVPASCGTDFNDLYFEDGVDAVRGCFSMLGGAQHV